MYDIGVLGFGEVVVARLKRSESRDTLARDGHAPDFASLNPGYASLPDFRADDLTGLWVDCDLRNQTEVTIGWIIATAITVLHIGTFPDCTSLRQLGTNDEACSLMDRNDRSPAKHVRGQLVGHLPQLIVLRDYGRFSGRVIEREQLRDIVFRYLHEIALRLCHGFV